MSTNRDVTSSERQQTDESLRLEREQADLALNTSLEALDEVADADPRPQARRGMMSARVSAAGLTRWSRKLLRLRAPSFSAGRASAPPPCTESSRRTGW